LLLVEGRGKKKKRGQKGLPFATSLMAKIKGLQAARELMEKGGKGGEKKYSLTKNSTSSFSKRGKRKKRGGEKKDKRGKGRGRRFASPTQGGKKRAGGGEGGEGRKKEVRSAREQF